MKEIELNTGTFFDKDIKTEFKECSINNLSYPELKKVTSLQTNKNDGSLLLHTEISAIKSMESCIYKVFILRNKMQYVSVRGIETRVNY